MSRLVVEMDVNRATAATNKSNKLPTNFGQLDHQDENLPTSTEYVRQTAAAQLPITDFDRININKRMEKVDPPEIESLRQVTKVTESLQLLLHYKNLMRKYTDYETEIKKMEKLSPTLNKFSDKDCQTNLESNSDVLINEIQTLITERQLIRGEVLEMLLKFEQLGRENEYLKLSQSSSERRSEQSLQTSEILIANYLHQIGKLNEDKITLQKDNTRMNGLIQNILTDEKSGKKLSVIETKLQEVQKELQNFETTYKKNSNNMQLLSNQLVAMRNDTKKTHKLEAQVKLTTDQVKIQQEKNDNYLQQIESLEKHIQTIANAELVNEHLTNEMAEIKSKLTISVTHIETLEKELKQMQDRNKDLETALEIRGTYQNCGSSKAIEIPKRKPDSHPSKDSRIVDESPITDHVRQSVVTTSDGDVASRTIDEEESISQRMDVSSPLEGSNETISLMAKTSGSKSSNIEQESSSAESHKMQNSQDDTTCPFQRIICYYRHVNLGNFESNDITVETVHPVSLIQISYDGRISDHLKTGRTAANADTKRRSPYLLRLTPKRRKIFDIVP